MSAEKIIAGYVSAGEQVVSPWNEKLQYEGRIDFDGEEGPVWVYPATCVRLRFRGRALKAVVTNLKGYFDNYMGFVLDGKESKVRLADSGITVISIGENLEFEEHELCLFKRQDSCHFVIIHGFIGDQDFELLDPPPLSNRRIEVYGDSVSAGEVSEAVEYCGQPDPEHNGEFSNSYYSYAWLTARKLEARLHDIAQGGAALLDDTGWYSGGIRAEDGSVSGRFTGMETIYDKVRYHLHIMDSKQWNFDNYKPHVVIVAIGQNDSNPEDYMAHDYHCDKAAHWREQYGKFLRTLRSIHPKAHIICTTTILGHDSNWDKAIDQVCMELQDDRVHHFLYSKNGCGTPGHIRIPEAEQMAEELSAYIRSLGDAVWNSEEVSS